MITKARWIWQQPEWPNFRYDAQLVSTEVGEAHRMRGLVDGKATALGFNSVGELSRSVLVDEALATSAIEGELLPMDVVHKAVMQH